MQRAAQKKTGNKQATKAVARKVAKTPKVTKRTMTTKRAIKRQSSVTQPQQQQFAQFTAAAPLSLVATPLFAGKKIVAPRAAFTTQMSFRAFGGHAAGPAPIAKFDYDGVQVEKYGKQKIEMSLFETDTPTFKKAFGTIDTEGKTLSARPAKQELTAEEFCERFGIVLVDRDIAHCEGTPDGPHPQEFIQVNTSTPTVPQICKYCGTRFLMKSAFDGSFIPFEQEH